MCQINRLIAAVFIIVFTGGSWGGPVPVHAQEECTLADTGCYYICGIRSPWEDYYQLGYVRFWCWNGTRYVLRTYSGGCCYSA